MKWPTDHVSEQGVQWITAALKPGIQAERQSITGPKKKKPKEKKKKKKKKETKEITPYKTQEITVLGENKLPV